MTISAMFLRSLAVGAVAALWAGNASAIPFSGTFTVSPIQTADNGGVKLSTSGIGPITFDINQGGSFQNNAFFTIGITDNNGIDQSPDDNTHANPIGVNFSFTTPNNGAGAITGTTLGYLIIRATNPDTPAHLDIVWDNSPITIAFGGINLKVALANLTITCPLTNNKCDPAGTGGIVTGNVAATFTYEGPVGAPVGETPLPGALPMFVAGLGMIGGLTYRKRRNARKLAV